MIFIRKLGVHSNNIKDGETKNRSGSRFRHPGTGFSLWRSGKVTTHAPTRSGNRWSHRTQTFVSSIIKFSTGKLHFFALENLLVSTTRSWWIVFYNILVLKYLEYWFGFVRKSGDYTFTFFPRACLIVFVFNLSEVAWRRHDDRWQIVIGGYLFFRDALDVFPPPVYYFYQFCTRKFFFVQLKNWASINGVD